MRRVKHHSRSISQLLIIGLLSSSFVLIVGLLSYWLIVLRLLKSILKRKEKQEETTEIRPVPIVNIGDSPVLSHEVEPQTKAIDTKVEPEPKVEAKPTAIDTKVEAKPKAVETKVEPEPKTIDTKVEPEPTAVETKVEHKPTAVDTKVEPEPEVVETKVEHKPKAIDTKVEAEGDASAEAYCVKCRQRQVIQGAKKVTTQKGRRALEGTCPVCGTKLFRFIAREKENLS
ncbi:MAG TPA: DUF5679 domain-containing protein [Ktedonobacteraceae bacterium]